MTRIESPLLFLLAWYAFVPRALRQHSFFGKLFFKIRAQPFKVNGTRRVTMPQVLTRRSEPIALLAKRGHLHLQTQKLALVVITQEAEAHSLCSISLSHSLVHWCPVAC